jgi:hypothetical protein
VQESFKRKAEIEVADSDELWRVLGILIAAMRDVARDWETETGRPDLHFDAKTDRGNIRRATDFETIKQRCLDAGTGFEGFGAYLFDGVRTEVRASDELRHRHDRRVFVNVFRNMHSKRRIFLVVEAPVESHVLGVLAYLQESAKRGVVGEQSDTVRTVSAAIVAPDSPPESVVTPPRLEPSPAAQGRDDDVPWYRSRGVRDSAIVAALVAVAGVATVAVSRWL